MSRRTRYSDDAADNTVSRFWSKVDVVENQCWLWTGKINKEGGYGRLLVNGKYMQAHRYSWTIHNGDIPSGINVLHNCDITTCVNPSHLFLGTQLDNVHDCLLKGRHVSPKGEDNGNSKLTTEQVEEIRRMYKGRVYGMGYRSIARKFGVSHTLIRYIIIGKLWNDTTN